MSLREDAKRIIAEAIGAVQPRQAVGAALAGRQYQGRVIRWPSAKRPILWPQPPPTP